MAEERWPVECGADMECCLCVRLPYFPCSSLPAQQPEGSCERDHILLLFKQIPCLGNPLLVKQRLHPAGDDEAWYILPLQSLPPQQTFLSLSPSLTGHQPHWSSFPSQKLQVPSCLKTVPSSHTLSLCLAYSCSPVRSQLKWFISKKPAQTRCPRTRRHPTRKQKQMAP